MEFLDMNLTKVSSLLLYAIHSHFTWKILQKPYYNQVFKIMTKKSTKQDKSSLLKNSSLRSLELVPTKLN